MDPILTIDYICIDARTDARSFADLWQKRGYEGFRLTAHGLEERNNGNAFLDNGIRTAATHFAGEMLETGLHVVLQQAGPDVNLILGSVFIDDVTGETESIPVIQTAENLQQALDKIKYQAETRLNKLQQVIINVIGHQLCGLIALSSAGNLDINRDGFVTVAEYEAGEDALRNQVRVEQAHALMTVLGNVFQQGDSQYPLQLNMVDQLQTKFGDDYAAAQKFVNQQLRQRGSGGSFYTLSS